MTKEKKAEVNNMYPKVFQGFVKMLISMLESELSKKEIIKYLSRYLE